MIFSSGSTSTVLKELSRSSYFFKIHMVAVGPWFDVRSCWEGMDALRPMQQYYPVCTSKHFPINQ